MDRPETPAELMPRLLKLAPGFAELWKEHLEYWKGEPAGVYNDTSEFCRFVLDCFAAGETEWFPEYFELIEDLLENGSPELVEIATLGLLETLQVQASHRPHGEDVFGKWLGPESQRTWTRIQAVWDGHGNLLNIVRSEKRG